METNSKIMLSFIGGAAIGALISFAVLKEKYEKLAQEEIDSMNEYYKKELTDRDDAYSAELDRLHVAEAAIEEESKTYVDYVKKYNPSEKVSDEDYNKPYPIEEEDDEELSGDETEFYEDIIDGPPYLIDREEFDETCLHFDKITISYYDRDDVLADEQEEVIPDVESVIGYAALSHFGSDPDEPDVVYVRNARLGSDYEVCRVDLSYSESVLGIIDKGSRK